MQTDVGVSPYAPGPEDNPLYTAEPLTLEDLNLLSELFYLPYEYGPTARTMLQELDWLKSNSRAASAETDQVHLGSDTRQGYPPGFRFLFPSHNNMALLSGVLSDSRVALAGAVLRPDVRGGGADVQPPVQRPQPQNPVRSL